MPGLREDLEELLEKVRRGELEPKRALDLLAQLPFRDLGFARADLHRELRQGAPEAVLAEGKTPEQIAAIARALLEGGAGSVLVTNSPHFIHNWIVHVFTSISSSGVQIIGALSPLARQTASITGRIVALAKCRQFHVNR